MVEKVSNNDSNLATHARTLEFKKNSLKLKIENYKETKIYNDFNFTLIWLAIVAPSSKLKEYFYKKIK